MALSHVFGRRLTVLSISDRRQSRVKNRVNCQMQRCQYPTKSFYVKSEVLMSDEDRAQINALIVAKQYEEAKAILRQFSDPATQSWLQSLEQKFPVAGSVKPFQTAGWSESLNAKAEPYSIVQTLGLPLTIVIFIGGWIVASQVKDPEILLVGICGGMLVLGL